MKKLLVILGPTAVGKTDFSIETAISLGSPVISCDSRQIYREMSIGTAVPSASQLAAVKHYFIHTHTVQDLYTAGKYEIEALDLIRSLFDEGHETLVMAGGSGFYIDAVCNGLDDFPPADQSLRSELTERLASEGVESLRLDLKRLDPESNRRVLQMVDDGLVEEVRSLVQFRNLPALQTVGYKEIFDWFDFLDGKVSSEGWTPQTPGDGPVTSLERAVELIQRNTRHYAKRQLSYWNRDKSIKWKQI